ncbi:MAG TPA: efflux RND transporter periplasmic adaptor subunit [Propionibacterium sp.]|nr:efflux RND transporter periplasmic adaptor subunit [Propionibacterium sp.]
MTWANRFRLLVGVTVILALMAALTLLYNQRQSRVASTTAAIDVPTAVVGSGYGGVVTLSSVELGQPVTAGQELFVVHSPDMLHAVSQGSDPQSNEAYRVDTEAGTITYTAVIDGQVTGLTATAGSYLPPGASLATLSADSPRTVLAEYVLEPTDYGRVERGAAVTVNLADDQQVEGTVSDVTVVTEDGQAVTRVRVEAPGLTDPRYEHLTRGGSPVQAVLSLRDDGILAGPTHEMLSFLTKIGLR